MMSCVAIVICVDNLEQTDCGASSEHGRYPDPYVSVEYKDLDPVRIY